MRPLLVLLLLGLTAAQLVEVENIDYNEEQARLLLEISAASYAADPRVCVQKLMPTEDAWTVLRAKEVPCDSKDNLCAVFVMSSEKKKEIIVSFRGTVGEKQLNLETAESLKPDVDWFGYGRVGRYFLGALNKTWETVEPALRDPKMSSYRVTFTGYSLGGALASLASTRTIGMRLRDGDMIRLVTFGQPRVGNGAYATSHDHLVENSYRVVHKADIVPHLPPCKDENSITDCDRKDPKWNFHHATEVWYNNDMQAGSSFIICTKGDEDDHCSNSMVFKFKPSDHLTYFGHIVAEYGANNCTDVDHSSAASHVPSLLSAFILFVFLVC